MSFLLRGRESAVLMVKLFAVAGVLLSVDVSPAAAEDMISVNVDQAKLVRFPDKIATIVVGNPLIADVALQPGGIVVVTGKGYGATNVIAMDRAGGVLMDRTIQVAGPVGKVVTVYRGMNRESYSCAPHCERRVTLGDADAYFKTTMEQAGAIGTQTVASGATTGSGGRVR